MPGYLAKAAELKAKGVSDVLMYCVNDAAVMKAWAADQKVGPDDIVTMLADTSCEFTKALGLVMDHPGPVKVLGGLRSKRFSMLIDDGMIKIINVAEAEGDPSGDGDPTVSLVDKMLADL